MAEHKAWVSWEFTGGEFLRGKYMRGHTWKFDGGATVMGAPAPGNVPVAFGNAAGVDPEEALVAALSSCHMLTFLFVAFKAGFEVMKYEDEAVGETSWNQRGALWLSKVRLRPLIVYGAKCPNAEEEEALHHRAHEECIIANSVKTEVVVEGRG